MQEESLPRPVEDVVFRELKGQVVLVQLATGRIYALNETGARFWQLLASGRGRDEIRTQMLEEFSIDPEQLDDEIHALLADLVGSGLAR